MSKENSTTQVLCTSSPSHPSPVFPSELAIADETHKEDGEEQKIHEQGAGGRTRDDDLARARSDRQNPICILAGTTTPVAEEKQKKEDTPHRKKTAWGET